MKKKIALLMATVMLFGVTVGATLAWLQDTTEEVVNTFTVGNIEIDLNEHNYNPETGELDVDDPVKVEGVYKMVPGVELPKDPFVSVLEGSEDCWIFVEVTESDNLDEFISYRLTTDWTLVDDEENIYKYKEPVSAEDDDVYVLEENKVIVKSTVTKEMMDAIENDEAEEPTLTFIAYAVQTSSEFATAQDAWNATFGATN